MLHSLQFIILMYNMHNAVENDMPFEKTLYEARI